VGEKSVTGKRELAEEATRRNNARQKECCLTLPKKEHLILPGKGERQSIVVRQKLLTGKEGKGET